MTHGIIWYQDISADTVDINELHLVVALSRPRRHISALAIRSSLVEVLGNQNGVTRPTLF